MTDPDYIQDLGAKIDLAIDEGRVMDLDQLDRECSGHFEANDVYHATIHYYRANIAAGIRKATNPKSWDWRQPHLEREILHLRRARADPSFDSLHLGRRAQIVTNLAGVMNTLGRSLESLRLYDEVLRLIPDFGMAVANLGIARLTFARMLHDPGHATLFAALACQNFEAARTDDVIWEADYPAMDAMLAGEIGSIRRAIDVEAVLAEISLDGWDIGEGEERVYRQRVLDMGLFLNPLNALGPRTIAARDQLHLPSHRYGITDPPQYLAWYNQLKQEFIAARFLYHEAMDGPPLEDHEIHFADRDVRLVDTLDYPALSIAVEKLRLSFRCAYGLLDKIAGFLNAYFALGLGPKEVDMRGVWYTDRHKRHELRPEFRDRANLPLRGLFWLSFDILGATGDDDAIAPGAAHLNHLRNTVEHRCLVLTEEGFGEPMGAVETERLTDFRAHTQRILELVHEALVLLSLSMHVEEKHHQEPTLSVDLYLPDLER